MKALIADTIQFSFFSVMVAAFAGVGKAITWLIGLVPIRSHGIA